MPPDRAYGFIAALLFGLCVSGPAVAQGELPLCEADGAFAAWKYEAAPAFVKVSTDGVAICDGLCRGASFEVWRDDAGEISVQFVPIFAEKLASREFDVMLALSGWPGESVPISTDNTAVWDDGRRGYVLDITPLFSGPVLDTIIEASSIEILARHASGEGVALEIDALGLAEAWAAGEAEAARLSSELDAGRCEDIW